MTYGRGKTRSAQSSGVWLSVAEEWFRRSTFSSYGGKNPEVNMWLALMLAANAGEI